jgi:putative hydrolase of the HAD superfamily
MAIRAIIFDLGGVLIDIDWQRYREDKTQGNDSWPYEYEQLNIQLARFVANLRPRYKTATICNRGSREAMNRKFQLDTLFDLMVYDNEEGVSKPDPRIYQLTLKRLDLEPYETIFVDNKTQNVEAAQRLGIFAILFRDTDQSISDIQNLLSSPS